MSAVPERIAQIGSPIRIALSADESFLPHAATMLHSLFSSNSAEALELNLLRDETLPQTAVDKLSRWVEGQGQSLRVHLVPADLRRGFPDKMFHPSVWYRLLLPQLFPQADRMIYLDSDVVVMNSLRPLWETSLGTNLFAAVVNPIYASMRDWVLQRPGMPDAGRYVNSGVLLLDLERWRQERCIEALRRYAEQHPDNPYPEQDALVAVLHARCLLLHPRWNVQTTFFNMTLPEIPWPAAEVREALSDPAIVHFVGVRKPTHVLCRNPFQRTYLKHRQATPWPLSRIEGRTPVNWVLRRLPVSWEIGYERAMRCVRGALPRSFR